MKSQGDICFPADGHKAIVNKMNNKSKTNRKLFQNMPTSKILKNDAVSLIEIYENAQIQQQYDDKI